MVAQLAHYFGSEIHLVGTTKYSDEESSRIVQQYVDQSVSLLAQEGLEVQTKIEIGTNIVKCTLDYAESIDADLVIMMSESEPSSGLFMGSNAQQLVNHSKVPVMTLQPVDVGIGITGY
jgi:nucleotide-binding universal stress UspA family protein